MLDATKSTEEEEADQADEKEKEERGEGSSTRSGVSTSAFDIDSAILTLWSSGTKVDAQSQVQIRFATCHRRNPDVSLNLPIEHAHEMQTK